MQLLQMAGLPGKRANPTWRRTAPPGPSKGAAHSLQWGELGRRRKTRLERARPGVLSGEETLHRLLWGPPRHRPAMLSPRQQGHLIHDRSEKLDGESHRNRRA